MIIHNLKVFTVELEYLPLNSSTCSDFEAFLFIEGFKYFFLRQLTCLEHIQKSNGLLSAKKCNEIPFR